MVQRYFLLGCLHSLSDTQKARRPRIFVGYRFYPYFSPRGTLHCSSARAATSAATAAHHRPHAQHLCHGVVDQRQQQAITQLRHQGHLVLLRVEPVLFLAHAVLEHLQPQRLLLAVALQLAELAASKG